MNKYEKILLCLVSVFLFAACSKEEKKVDLDKLTPKEQIALLDARIRKEPKNDELYYKRAEVFFRAENTKEAFDNIQKAISLRPREVKYHILKADIMFAQGETKSAFASLQKAIEIDGKCIEAYLKSAELSLYMKDYEKTLFNVKQAILLDKLNPTAYFMRGWVLKEQGDTVRAVEDYKKAIELKSDYEQAFEELGLLYAVKGDGLAVEYLKSTININPENLNAMYALALFYQEHDAMQQALDMYKRILDIRPDHADALNNVGYINYSEKKEYDIAIECFTSAIKSDSTFWQAYLNRADAYKAKGMMKEAEADYKRAEELRG